MRTHKAYTAVVACLALGATIASAPVSPAFADSRWTAAGAGFAAGLVGGAIIANRGYGYYGYPPPFAYGPGYLPPPVYGYGGYAPGYYRYGYVRPYRYLPYRAYGYYRPGRYGYAYAPRGYGYHYNYNYNYNSKQTIDPDPRIGGSLKASGAE